MSYLLYTYNKQMYIFNIRNINIVRNSHDYRLYYRLGNVHILFLSLHIRFMLANTLSLAFWTGFRVARVANTAFGMENRTALVALK